MKALVIAALFCTLYIPPGGYYVIGTSHYAHKYPVGGDLTWSSSVGAWVFGPVIMNATSPGHPVGHELIILGGSSVQCGEIPNPNRIFSDGFESGDTREWTSLTE